MSKENNSNNLEEMFAQFLQFMQQQKEKEQQQNRKWEDITIEEVNRGHLIEFKEAAIPVMQIQKGSPICNKVVYKGKYKWNGYGDIQYMRLEDVGQMLSSDYKGTYKRALKPLDDKIIKLFNLEEYYNLVDNVSDKDIGTLVKEPIEEQMKFVKSIKENLGNDCFRDLRSNVCLYFINAKDDLTLGQIKEILPIYELTEFDIYLTNKE